MYNGSITRLRVRSVFYLPVFMLHAMRTMTQAQKAEGVLGVETRSEKNNVVWTKTICQDEAHRRLLAEGKLSKVKHPYPLQASRRTA